MVVYLKCLVVTRLVPCETSAILGHSGYTIHPCTMWHHFMQSHISRVHAYYSHLHFWKTDHDLLQATVVNRGQHSGGMYTEVRVSAESWPWRIKFSRCSCQDLNLLYSDNESVALDNHWAIHAPQWLLLGKEKASIYAAWLLNSYENNFWSCWKCFHGKI